MEMECPGCATVVTIAVEGDLPDFPIRIEWDPAVDGRYIGWAMVDGHEPASELRYPIDSGRNTWEITVVYDEEFLGVDDMYGQQLFVVHECARSDEAGDRARLPQPPPTRSTSN